MGLSMSIEDRIAMRDESQDDMANAICANNIFNFLNVRPQIYLPTGTENAAKLIYLATKALRDSNARQGLTA